jgi:hypothetical protein
MIIQIAAYFTLVGHVTPYNTTTHKLRILEFLNIVFYDILISCDRAS